MAPPARERTRLSAINWRTSKNRLAPTARRIAISFCLPTARARSRLATLAQAMSSKQPDNSEQDEERIVELFAQVGKTFAGRVRRSAVWWQTRCGCAPNGTSWLHLHDQETVVVRFHAGLGLVGADAGAKTADELQP